MKNEKRNDRVANHVALNGHLIHNKNNGGAYVFVYVFLDDLIYHTVHITIIESACIIIIGHVTNWY
jgi:hypothetical protein